MTLQEAIEEVKENDAGLGYRERDIEEGFDFSLRARTAIATILNAVVKGELVKRHDIIESVCEEGFASVPFTITPPKPEIYNGKPNHVYRWTCDKTGKAYYGVTDETGHTELKPSSGESVKGELK